MARSLGLIIDDMVEVEKDSITKGAKDLVLDSLAHLGNALLGESPAGELIWVASPELTSRYVMGMQWRPLQPHGRPALFAWTMFSRERLSGSGMLRGRTLVRPNRDDLLRVLGF
jgi:hypothetical protein